MVSSLDKAVLIERVVVDSILSYAQMLHPREAVLLLKGKVDKHRIVVNARAQKQQVLEVHGMHAVCKPFY